MLPNAPTPPEDVKVAHWATYPASAWPDALGQVVGPTTYGSFLACVAHAPIDKMKCRLGFAYVVPA